MSLGGTEHCLLPAHSPIFCRFWLQCVQLSQGCHLGWVQNNCCTKPAVPRIAYRVFLKTVDSGFATKNPRFLSNLGPLFAFHELSRHFSAFFCQTDPEIGQSGMQPWSFHNNRILYPTFLKNSLTRGSIGTNSEFSPKQNEFSPKTNLRSARNTLKRRRKRRFEVSF
jgi:hypothetical protein